MDLEVGAARVRLERLGHHHRPKVAAADAQVDHIRNLLAGEAEPLARAHLVHEDLELAEHFVDLRHHVGTIHDDRRVGTVAQRHMQHRALLRRVDLLAGKHLLRLTEHVCLLAHRLQERHRLVGHDVLGVVEQDVLECCAEFLEAIRILGEEVAHVRGVQRLVVV